jgi:GNAT superfamily N-acetyltransferase
VVESGGLENRCAGNRTEGSNPSPSASNPANRARCAGSRVAAGESAGSVRVAELPLRPTTARPEVADDMATMRPLTAGDRALRERCMLLAGFPPDDTPPDDALDMPHVRRFLDGWGRGGDVGVVAEDAEGRPVGAAWARVFDVPLVRGDGGAPVAELAIAVEPAARGAGVGASLLEALAAAATDAGHRELSLNVSPRNRARRLYERAGFAVVREDAHGVVMRRRLP